MWGFLWIIPFSQLSYVVEWVGDEASGRFSAYFFLFCDKGTHQKGYSANYWLQLILDFSLRTSTHERGGIGTHIGLPVRYRTNENESTWDPYLVCKDDCERSGLFKLKIWIRISIHQCQQSFPYISSCFTGLTLGFFPIYKFLFLTQIQLNPLLQTFRFSDLPYSSS